MLKTYLYIPDELNEKIEHSAKLRKKSKAEIMRQALQEGLIVVERQHGGGAEILLKLAELGQKYHPLGPKDLSANLDKYLWGIEKDKNE